MNNLCAYLHTYSNSNSCVPVEILVSYSYYTVSNYALMKSTRRNVSNGDSLMLSLSQKTIMESGFMKNPDRLQKVSSVFDREKNKAIN